MNHIAFERLDNENLDMALGTYMCFPEACRAHMLQTMAFDWKLRTYPLFCEAFPADSAILNSRWAYLKAGGTTRWLAPKAEDTALTRTEFMLLCNGQGSALQSVLDKMAANPKHDDVMGLLAFTCREPEELVGAYTFEVHAKLVALKEPLKALIHDINDKNKAVVEPPVRAIGTELNLLGGLKAQQAVCYLMRALLYNEKSHCSDGSLWSDAGSALTTAWDGCGQWIA